jgi:transcriptional regulator with XRE-family HTH domain
MISPLGERIKMLRILGGFSQNALAKRAGISRPTISFIESGHTRTMSFDRAQKIATALGIPIDMLAEREHVWRILMNS